MLPSKGSAVIIVAHPDDEILWSGGLLLSNPQIDWQIISLCRKNDPDRAPRFFKILHLLGAGGAMGNLDDGPDQRPLDPEEVTNALLSLLPLQTYDLVLTHHPRGEYTRHRRHEEIAAAVISAWNNGLIKAGELWTFAYEDGNKTYYPKADPAADILFPLPEDIQDLKYRYITDVYGFKADSWEAKTTPFLEAFWKFTDSNIAMQWLAENSMI